MTAQCKTRPCRNLRDDEPPKPPREKGKAEPGHEPDVAAHESRSVLVCKNCRSPVTRQDLAMEVNGSFRHVFFNPAGEVFELGCFASARNVTVTGPPTDEFTWFPGFQWQVVVCTGCLTQLGWRYTGGHGGFFGLILSRLKEEFETDHSG